LSKWGVHYTRVRRTNKVPTVFDPRLKSSHFQSQQNKPNLNFQVVAEIRKISQAHLAYLIGELVQTGDCAANESIY